MKDLLSNAGVLLTVGSLIMSLLLAFTPGGPASDDPGDAGEDIGYVVPDAETQAKLTTIHDELVFAVNALRMKEHVPPLALDSHMERTAQRHAQKVAVLGTHVDSPNNVTLLQHSLPLEEASGHAFMEAWLHSAPHTAVLIDARYSFHGTGVAVGHGRVWVTLQLSAR
ncbi:hypothetical protein B842_10560 [Corynebacterium humireducens NBRC 106098 = DSM 45392]|uniref:SCP domain-containing protein n=2 Tax=Corynebacterium humireducens TaxID=1223514 RepID=A0A0B5D576_9CORY|nr:hypothetical protein B842_10560 [Corynebacterium humireducens NBRC 106098 = DSM 45392]